MLEQLIAETGIIQGLNHNKKTITLKGKFKNPVVFASPLSHKGSDPAIVRIFDVKRDRFTAYIQEPSDKNGYHPKEEFSYIVLEKGNWQLEDGNIVEVGTIATDLLKDKGWGNIGFAQNFTSTPAIFSQMQTANDPTFVLTRQNNPSNRGFEVKIQEEEKQLYTPHDSEVIGWFAIATNTGVWSNNRYQAENIPEGVSEKWSNVEFDRPIDKTVFLGAIASYKGADPCGLRINNLDREGAQIKVEEETSADTEIYHTKEQVNFMAIGGENNLLTGRPATDFFYYNSKEKGTLHIGTAATRPYKIGSYHCSVWTSKNFSGNFNRQLRADGKMLKVELQAKKGGFDVGLIEMLKPCLVDEAGPILKSSWAIETHLTGAGHWWAGPKFSVKKDIKQNFHNNYENYVVENSSRTPELLHRRMSYMGTYLGETTQGGSTYKHYLNQHNTWGQFWAIRQEYRNDWDVNLKLILAMWRKHGLPNHYLSDLRANIETEEALKGTILFNT